jgi:TRAP-type mannitol/chloroaromatic compound transport system permease small subunit
MRILGFIEKISDWTGKVFSLTACIMMMILGYEIIARYVFNAPSIWAPEWVPLLCGIYCIMGGAYTMVSRMHVNVDLIYAKASQRSRTILDLITFPIGFVFFVALLYGSVRFAWSSVELFEDSGTTAQTPVWIAKCMLPIGTFLMGIQWISNIILDCRKVFFGK